jgi:hypothetical protein
MINIRLEQERRNCNVDVHFRGSFQKTILEILERKRSVKVVLVELSKGEAVMLHSAALFGSMYIIFQLANSNCTRSH